MKNILKRLYGVIGFIIYIILMCPLFFPYFIIKGDTELLEKPLYYFIEIMDNE